MKPIHERIERMTARNKLIASAAAFTLLFCVLFGMLMLNLNRLYYEYRGVSAVCAELEDGARQIVDLHGQLSGLIYRGVDEQSARFSADVQKIVRYFGAIAVRPRDYETYYQLRDLKNLIATYAADSAALLNRVNEGNYATSGGYYAQLDNIVGYIRSDTEKLVAKLYEGSGVLYLSISRQMLLFNICLPFVSAVIVGYTVYMAVYLNRRFIRPIYQLSEMASRISGGSYPDKKLVFEAESDFNLLSDTMFSMSATIRDNIEDINNRARMHRELNAQQIENLRIKSLYNQLELRRLQEQINPHFLFNSLSTLQHTAYLEGADKTCEICNAISKLLRYNFRQGGGAVTLEDELENLGHYIYIQGLRFADRVAVRMDVPPAVPPVRMPRMILQPIVENCYSHGLSDMRNGGVISIRITPAEECVRVEIGDNGKGIDPAKVREYEWLFKLEAIDTSDREHIGLLNVAKRLQGFYGRQDVVALGGGEGGLRVELRLFYAEGGTDA